MLKQYLQTFVVKYKKYGTTPNIIDLAKFVAIVTMVIDHIGFYFYPDELWWRAIGRMSLPIWGFFAGYSRPSKFNYDIYVLCILLAVVKAGVLMPILPVNILATIILCRFYADFLRKGNKLQKYGLINLFVLLVALTVWFIPISYIFEYGSLAFIFTICGILQREMPGNLHTTVAFTFATISFIFIEYFTFGFSVPQFIIMAIGVVLVMHLLSGMKMRQCQYFDKFHYITKTGMFLARNSLYFYFLHIAIFAILSKIIFPERYTLFKWF